MGSQGPGRKRTPNKNGLTAEEDALNIIAREAETRLAAKRAARAEAREIRMRELERQQKEIYQVQKKYYGLDIVDNKWGDIEQWMENSERYTHPSQKHGPMSDDEEQLSLGSSGSLQLDNRLDKDILEKVSSRASTLSTATLASLGETSSCRGSGDSSVTMNAELSLQEIKEIHELKDQIQDVETKYTQSLKDIKDSLAEMEEKYRKAMVSNAQLDNEKSNLMYQVDTLKDSLMELEELLAETRRDLEEKNKDLEREKHSHNILQFKFKELEETLKQSEELLTEIRQLRLRQDGFVREVSDLQETIEWKDKKIGALERQKEYSDAIRNERDELRDEVVHLRDILKRHGIVLGPDLSINKEEEEGEKWEKTDGSACIEVQEGSSVLGTQEMQLGRDENIGCCREGQDQHPEDLYHGVQESHLPPHTQGSSSERPLATQYDEHLGDYLNNDFHQIPNNVEKSQCVVFDPEAIMSTSQFKDEIIGGKEVLVKEGKVGELEHLTGPRTADQNESLVSINISEVLKVQSPGFTHYTCEVPLVSPGHEYQSAETVVLDTQSEKTEVQSREIDKNVKQTVSTSSKKKRKKKKSKQKQKQGCEEKECNLESQKKNENQLKLGSLEDITVNQNVIMNLDFEEKTQPVNDSVDSVKLQSLESRTVDLFLESDDKTKCTSEVKNEKEMAQVANVSVELATGNQISHLDEMKGELIRAVKNERATQRDIQHGCTIEVDSMDVKACFKDLCRNPLELNHSSAKTSPDSSLIYKQFQVMTALKHPGEEAPESKAEENLVECVLEESSSVMPSWFSVKTNEEIIGSKKNVQEKIKAWQKQECDVVCATSQEHTCINSGPQELMQAQDEYMEDIKMSQGKQQTKKEGSVTEDLLGEKEENIILQQQDIPEQEHLEMKDDEYNVQETEAWQKPECDVACAASQEHMYMNSGPQELMQTQDVGEHQEVQTYKEDIKMSQGEQQINKESFLTEDPLVKKEEHIIHQQQDLEMKDDEDSVGEETGAAHNQNLDKPLLDVVELGQVINSIVQGGSQNLGEQAVEVMTGMNEEDLRRGTKKENKKGKAKSKEDCKMS